MRLVYLDSGPLGLLTNARGKPGPEQCRRWAQALLSAGVRIFVPEIADYEVRRELIRAGASAGLRRLDDVRATLEFVPITSEMMLSAAQLWAEARRAGLPTAAPHALDGDCILAAQSLLSATPGDEALVATDNVGHLGRFVDARPWETVTA